MAKDGTYRGGRRVRAGDKPLPAAEKLQSGQTVQIMKNDIPDLEPSELEAVDLPEGAVLQGVDMPKPGDYLSARQKNGVPLGADEIYKEVELADDNFKIFTAENDRKAQETALTIAKDFGSDFCQVSVYEEET